MAYTTDATWVAGELVDAADMNAYLRDNMKWLSTDKPMYRGYNDADLTMTAATFTPLQMNQERFDNAGMHDTVTNNTRVTVPSGGAGKYLFGGHVEGNGAGDNLEAMRLIVNGSVSFAERGNETATGNNRGASVSGFYALVVADYVTCDVYSDGADVMGATGNNSPECWALWLGI